MNLEKFRGVMPALMTAFNGKQELDFEALEGIIEYLIQKGVHGVYITGSTGEGLSMSMEERNSVVREICACVNKRIPVIAHTGAISTKQAITLSESAEKAGVDAISAIPPFYYKFSQSEIIEHYKSIAGSTDLPLFVYNIPATTGVDLPIATCRELLEVENIIGLKYTSMDIFSMERIINLPAKPIVFSGSDEMSFYGLWAGASGLVGSSYNLLADIVVKIYNYFNAKNYNEAHNHYKLASEILHALLQYPYFSAVREVLRWVGVDIGNPRSPFRAISPEESQQLRQSIKQILELYPTIETSLREI